MNGKETNDKKSFLVELPVKLWASVSIRANTAEEIRDCLEKQNPPRRMDEFLCNSLQYSYFDLGELLWSKAEISVQDIEEPDFEIIGGAWQE